MTSIVFMGTPAFAAPILESLIKEQYQVLGVVTQPDRKVGRKHVLTASPVKEVAVAHDIPVFQPEKISGSPEMQQIIDLQPDLIVTAAFGQFLPTKLLKAAKIGAVNVHGSLLPKYRGGAPVQYSIINGESETGITIIYMVKKMDAGDMLAQRAIPIEKNDDTGTMFDKLSLVGRDLLLETLPKLIAGEITAVPQDESQVTFAPNIQPEQEVLDFFTKTAVEIDNQVRGMRPAPIAYAVLDGKRTKFWDVTPLADEVVTQAPGQVVRKTKHELVIAAANHTAIAINQLQPAGKPKMTITDYLNGAAEKFATGEQVINK
ncbi:methionyl-tRNA formyltransferase [Lactiplantibacillus plantarum]|uniref:methionyl-tRNA formyltransferase n=1 Tax=Lactiplantibacillus plantarum TaxID=1590 RepID=UPI000D58BE2D|nr:methionyl-tRNA formyltransferase [Lactiplantibacillus plantarum]AWI40262.1 methionyl-tRNA formyltransferase [Lactiplantibacillus plantarum]WLT34846.1 methionyl-tRNA formyltransferase [Lactiplantibacillus plantarum]